MYRNSKTGQILSDEDVDQIISSWATRGSVGRPRECVLEDLAESGFEYIVGIVEEPAIVPDETFEQ